MERTIKDYATHLDDCNINKDWSEAFDAMADTPTQFRDFAFDQAYQELKTKSMTCTCGLEQLLASKPSEQKQLSSGDQFPPFRKFTFENSDQSTIATDNTLPPEDVSKEEILESVFGNKGLDLREITSKPLYAVYQAMEQYAEVYAQQSRQQASVDGHKGIYQALYDLCDHLTMIDEEGHFSRLHQGYADDLREMVKIGQKELEKAVKEVAP